MNHLEAAEITAQGLWRNNPGFVQLLGLCPLLAVSGTVVNALGMGLATTLVLLASNTCVSAIRHLVRDDIRLPVFVLIIAAFVTTTELLMSAFLHQMHQILGIFIPLIVTNCAIIGRAEAYAARNPVPKAALDGLMMGVGFTLVLVLLGGLREIVGQGTLLADAQLLFGDVARDWRIVLLPDYRGFLLAALPPGAFIGLGLLIAAKNHIDARSRHPARAAQPLPTTQNP